MKLEKLNNSLFEKFKENEIENLGSIIGAGTKRKEDCNKSSGMNDDRTGWNEDSSKRAEDHCNEPIFQQFGTFGAISFNSLNEPSE